MKDGLLLYSIIGIIAVSLVGSLMHFVYEWSGKNFIISLIAPVNESTWEHIKLLFFPMLLYSFIGIKKFQLEYPSIASALFIGIIVGCILIPVLFYTYTGILGFNKLFLDILVFVICVIIGFTVAYYVALNFTTVNHSGIIALIIFALAMSFFIFTFYPPNLNLFAEP